MLGVGLTALKYGLDRGLAALFGHDWLPWDYWAPSTLRLTSLPAHDRWFYVALLALAVPFMWIGVALTVRRLRAAGLPVWIVVLFFVPVLNVLLFALLALAPARARAADDGARRDDDLFGRLIPRSSWGAATVATAVTAAAALGVVVLSAEGLRQYGWGLFVANPFCLGLISALVYGYHEPRSLDSCIRVSLAALAVAYVALLAVALEGAICLIMAFPLVGLVAILGGTVGYLLQRRPPPVASARAYCAVALLLPALVAGEKAQGPRAPVHAVRTSVVVNAPPAAVWRSVVSFPRLPERRSLLFHAGVAYPIEARIVGHGVGATRYCVFSTGAFVEPITAWDAPHRLAFDVVREPAPMRELSPWGAIHTPHLDGFLRSRRGEFRLVPLPGGRTLLVGTTWYSDRIWPAAYWRVWSDAFIHRIHRRVLDHVKALAERRYRARGGELSARGSVGRSS